MSALTSPPMEEDSNRFGLCLLSWTLTRSEQAKTLCEAPMGRYQYHLYSRCFFTS